MKIKKRSASLLVGGMWLSVALAAEDPNLDMRTLAADAKAAVATYGGCPKVLREAVPCFKKLSQAGNRAASYTLAQIYAGPDSQGEPSGVDASKQESIRYTLLANKQGSLLALRFIPPQPYKAEVGMSDLQVRSSEFGDPTDITTEETEASYVQIWHYPGASLLFSRSPVSNRYVILKKITTTTAAAP
jgi:TPR repeat protein